MVDGSQCPGEKDTTVLLSSNLNPCDAFEYMQVTLACRDAASPATTLYRFADGEEVEHFELNGEELGKLLEMSGSACAPTFPNLEHKLDWAKSALVQASHGVAPDLVASIVLRDLVSFFACRLSEQQQTQVQEVLHLASSLIAAESKKK